MRIGPDDKPDAAEYKQEGGKQQANFAIAKEEENCRYCQQFRRPKIGYPAANQLFMGDAPCVVPRVVVISAFPAVVEILELFIAILHLRFFVIPQKKTRRVIRA